jgi:ParB family chromosome partitioning protein
MLKENKRKSLGRGLGVLLGDDLDVFDNNQKMNGDKNISIDSLFPSKYQPRSKFNEEALEALSQSIKEKGVLQPLLVREKIDGTYEIIAGERRYRASKRAGLKEVPVIIKDMSDKEVLEVALVENLLRENLSAIEEAEGLQRLIDEFSHAQEALSQIIGKSRSYIANTLRLLALPTIVQQMVKDNILSAGHVRPFIGWKNAEEMAKKVAEKGLNVRQAEALATKTKEDKFFGKAKIKDADIVFLEKNLAKKLNLKVKICSAKNGGGKITLSYDNIADLDKIIDILEQKNTLKPSGNTKFTMNIIE